MPAVDLAQFSYSAAGTVRTRAAAADPYAGLRGHAYIAARNLAAPVARQNHATPESLAAVLNIVEARKEARLQQLLDQLHGLQKVKQMARQTCTRRLAIVNAGAA